MEQRKIKVVWVCHLMNPEIGKHLPQTLSVGRKTKLFFARLFLRLIPPSNYGLKQGITKLCDKLSKPIPTEFAVWNTNGIIELKKRPEIELHIIAPLYWISRKGLCYEEDGVHYHFFRNQQGSFVYLIWREIYRLLIRKSYGMPANRKRIARYVEQIKPDIIHLIGAENSQYAMSIFDYGDSYPVLVQLQTLLSDPEAQAKVASYKISAINESAVLRKAKYIGTLINKYRDIIKTQINPDAIILNTSLAVSEKVFRSQRQTEYDFVYYSYNINKAGDLAIEAFGLAHQKNPNLTLHMIGGYDEVFKKKLDERIAYYGIQDAVTFEGLLPTHDDVLEHAKKAKYALLPIKIDIIPSTIREAFSNGLPIVTTITSGTPDLNKNGQCVLLSEVGDHQAMADNILKLVENTELTKSLAEKCYQYMETRVSNKKVADIWVEAYKVIINHYNNGTPIPISLVYQ